MSILSEHIIFDSLVPVNENGRWFDTGFDASAKRYLNIFKSESDNRAILVGLPGTGSQKQILYLSKKFQGRIMPIAGLTIKSDEGQKSLERKIRSFKNAGFMGIKIHPRISGISIGDKAVSNAIGIAGNFGMISMPLYSLPLSDETSGKACL